MPVRGGFALFSKDTQALACELRGLASAAGLHVLAVDADQGSVGAAGFA